MASKNDLTFRYDAGNRLISLSSGERFEYDFSGRRVQKTDNNATTSYFNAYYEEQVPAPTGPFSYLLWTGSGAPPEPDPPAETGVVTTYYYLNGLRVAQKRDGVWTWIHADHLHSATVMTNVNGNEVRRLAYRAFGEEVQNTGAGEKPPYTYTGKELDRTGLYYYGARYYDPVLCRFISPDSVYDRGPQGLNRYSYALNNPIRYNDPTGNTVESALGLISRHRKNISSLAAKYKIDPLLLAGVVFAENRNDYNWLRGRDWSSFPRDWFKLPGGPEIKNMIAPLVKDNPSLGITEITLAVAAMMDHPELVPTNYENLSRKGREKVHGQIAENLSSKEREDILMKLDDPQKALQYGAKYLKFLGNFRNYENNYALWLSDYNRGLSDYQTSTEYGRRINVYRTKIREALYGVMKLDYVEESTCDPNFRDPEVLQFPTLEDDGCQAGCVIWVDPPYQLPPGVDYCPECY